MQKPNISRQKLAEELDHTWRIDGSYAHSDAGRKVADRAIELLGFEVWDDDPACAPEGEWLLCMEAAHHYPMIMKRNGDAWVCTAELCEHEPPTYWMRVPQPPVIGSMRSNSLF